MTTYDYFCTACEKDFEIIESIKLHKSGPRPCPKCGELAEKNLHAGHFYVRNDPQTVGLQAARNTEKLGRYEKDSLRENDKWEQIKEKRRAKAPWWRPNTIGPSKEAMQAATDIANVTSKDKPDFSNEISDTTKKFLEGD